MFLRESKKARKTHPRDASGFRNGLGTRKARFGLNILIRRSLDMSKEIYLVFIDYEKAIDKVKEHRLLELPR